MSGFATSLVGETVEFTRDDDSTITGVIREITVSPYGDVTYLVEKSDGTLFKRTRSPSAPTKMRVVPTSPITTVMEHAQLTGMGAVEVDGDKPYHDPHSANLDAFVNWPGLARFLGTTVEEARKMSLKIEEALETGAAERREAAKRRPIR